MSEVPPPSAWRQQQGWGSAEPAAPTGSAYPPPPQAHPAYGGGDAGGYPVVDYADWWRRVVAILLDGVLVGVPLFIVGLVTGLIKTNNVSGTSGTFVGFRAGPGWLALSLIVPLLYYGILEGGPRGASVGKMAMHIRVQDADTGGPIGFGKALGRRFVYEILWYLLFLPGLINALSPLWDSRRQAWHDKAVNSVVVNT
jgi:uncharacterized RDD family membrane protein YckC